jgi:hypothetical protein
MPSTTRRQARLMAAAAHNPAFAKKVGLPQSVAKDFNKADAGTGILKGPLRRKRGRSGPMVAFTTPGS